MGSERHYYFVRANGHTWHNDPDRVGCYVRHEPPRFPETFFSYVDYSLTHGIARIGWSAVGDLRLVTEVPASTPCYRAHDRRYRKYLQGFHDIPVGSSILMPDRENSGLIYAGNVTGGYE